MSKTHLPGELRSETIQEIRKLLGIREEGGVRYGLFNNAQLDQIEAGLKQLAQHMKLHKPARIQAADNNFDPDRRFSHEDVLCIAYPDHIAQKSGDPRSALARLGEVFNRHLKPAYTHLHILPHFPCPTIHPELQGPASKADGGFEPESYKLDPTLGDETDLQNIDANLMFDFVLNHQSAKGETFRKFLEGQEGFEDFFMTLTPEQVEKLDLSEVFRPRKHHPVIEFQDAAGSPRNVWCTFSETQADINLKNPQVFLSVMKALAEDFIGQGAGWVRLDAVGYMIKMLGLEPNERSSNCFGLEETHNIIKVMNKLLGDIAPSVNLVAEVNATADVIATYYGDGDESHIAYEFPGSPLSLWTMYQSDASAVMAWAEKRTEHPDRIGLAFTSSHDGIPMLPLGDVDNLADGRSATEVFKTEAEARGGQINMKSKVIDGKTVNVPYEACLTWTQAVLTPEEQQGLHTNTLTDAQIDHAADRFLASQSFVFSAPHCVPSDYLGVIAGLLNDEDTFAATDHARNKNRGVIDADAFAKALENPETSREKLVQAMFQRKQTMIAARKSCEAFSPYAECTVGVAQSVGAHGTEPVYSLLRQAPNHGPQALCLTNVTAVPQTVQIPIDALTDGKKPPQALTDLLSDTRHALTGDTLHIELAPHQVAWLTP